MEIRLIFGTSTVLGDLMTDSSKVTYGQVVYTEWICRVDSGYSWSGLRDSFRWRFTAGNWTLKLWTGRVNVSREDTEQATALEMPERLELATWPATDRQQTLKAALC